MWCIQFQTYAHTLSIPNINPIGMLRENRNVSNSANLSPTILNNCGYLRRGTFIIWQNLGCPGNSKVANRLGFSRHMTTRLNPLNRKIKIWILICCPYSFPSEVVGKVDKISCKFTLCDHVHNSHDHPVLQSVDITKRNLMLITRRA